MCFKQVWPSCNEVDGDVTVELQRDIQGVVGEPSSLVTWPSMMEAAQIDATVMRKLGLAYRFVLPGNRN